MNNTQHFDDQTDDRLNQGGSDMDDENDTDEMNTYGSKGGSSSMRDSDSNTEDMDDDEM